MSNTIEAAKLIRESLKAAGIKARAVSVRADLYSMGSTICVRVKDPAVSLAKVAEIAERFQLVDRDEMTGEILSGGNRFVDVEYSADAVAALSAPVRDAINAIPADGTTVDVGHGYTGRFEAEGRFGGGYVYIYQAGNPTAAIHCYGRDFAARQFGALLAASR